MEFSMLVRVFELPNLRTDGFLFGGGKPFTFIQVDWFRAEPEQGAPDFSTPEGRTEAEKFIRAKKYFKDGWSYLVLHPTHPFTIDYSAP
jgi:hypothetical protein